MKTAMSIDADNLNKTLRKTILHGHEKELPVIDPEMENKIRAITLN